MSLSSLHSSSRFNKNGLITGTNISYIYSYLFIDYGHEVVLIGAPDLGLSPFASHLHLEVALVNVFDLANVLHEASLTCLRRGPLWAAVFEVDELRSRLLAPLKRFVLFLSLPHHLQEFYIQMSQLFLTRPDHLMDSLLNELFP